MCTLILIWKRCVGMAASGSYEKAEKSDKVLILYICNEVGMAFTSNNI